VKPLELGQQVKFNRYYRKNSNYVNFDKLTEAQAKEYDETDHISLQRIDEITLDKSLTGFIAGKRSMVKSNLLTYGYGRFDPDEHGSEHLQSIDSKSVTVYLIAVRMDRMYRVPEEWLEVSNEV
jgi:deoxycytidine triphosphate deaminase